MTAAYDDLTEGVSEPAGIDHCLDLLKPHLEGGVESLPPNLTREDAINHLVEYNVDRQVEFLVGSEEIPRGLDVVGVVYDFQDVYPGRRGEVHVVNVDDETDVEQLRNEYPEIASRVRRRWTY